MKSKLLKVYQITWEGQIMWELDKANILDNLRIPLQYLGSSIQITTITMSKKKWDSLGTWTQWEDK
jgi:hypothetical protein